MAAAVVAPYDSQLDSKVADLNNVSSGPFAGSITAALFLRRFVSVGGDLDAFRRLRLDPDRKAGAAGGRGMPGGARALCLSVGALRLIVPNLLRNPRGRKIIRSRNEFAWGRHGRRDARIAGAAAAA